MRRAAPDSGFTLIELVVVIAVMALLFSVGYASYREFAARQGIVNVTRKVKTDLRLAQEYALSQKKSDACVALDPDPSTPPDSLLIGYKFEVTSSKTYEIAEVCDDSPGPPPCNDGVGGGCDEDFAPPVKEDSIPADYDLSTTSDRYVLFLVRGRGARILPGGATNLLFTILDNNSGALRYLCVTSGGQIKEVETPTCP